MEQGDSFHESVAAAHNTGSSDRSFGITFAIVFAIFGLVPLLKSEPANIPALAGASFFAIVTILHAPALGLANRIWSRLGMLLMRVTNPVILGILFFVFIMPLGWLRRRRGDPLRLRNGSRETTYWIAVDQHPGPPDALRRQF